MEVPSVASPVAGASPRHRGRSPHSAPGCPRAPAIRSGAFGPRCHPFSIEQHRLRKPAVAQIADLVPPTTLSCPQPTRFPISDRVPGSPDRRWTHLTCLC